MKNTQLEKSDVVFYQILSFCGVKVDQEWRWIKMRCLVEVTGDKKIEPE